MKNRAILLIILGAATLAAGENAAVDRATQPASDRQMRDSVKKARTAGDHREIARQYEIRARHFEVRAAKHEEEADRLAKRDGYHPMAHKWPAMVQAPIDRERAKAMEARRAAKESLELAARHHELAGKAVADAGE